MFSTMIVAAFVSALALSSVACTAQFGENPAKHVIGIEIEQRRFRPTGQHTQQPLILRVALRVGELTGPGNPPEECDMRCAGQCQQQQDGDQSRKQDPL